MLEIVTVIPDDLFFYYFLMYTRSMNKTLGIWIVIIILVVLLGATSLLQRPGTQSTISPSPEPSKAISASPSPTSAPTLSFFYSCNTKKTLTATYTPQFDSVTVALSDGRSMTLPKTISADGMRYANSDESFIFWGKGNGALVLEHNQEKSYIGCILVAPAPTGQALPTVYSNGNEGFSLRLPEGYTVNEKYTYQALGPKKSIAGIQFTIPTSLTKGTNLSTDSYISVEQIPKSQTCTASSFLAGQPAAKNTTEHGTEYSMATATDAAAGNRYEETVYALVGTNPCIAVRYFIHYGVFENYPAGSVKQFDKDALIKQFDAIRSTLTVNQ